MEEIPRQFISNPLVSWGILISCLGALEDNIREAPSRLGFDRMNIGVNYPYEETTPSAIVVAIESLEVKKSGLYSAELTDPRNEVLLSSGSISLQLFTPSHNTLMTLVDYITQCYLMNMFDRKKLAYPGLQRDYVAIGYQGGVVNWSAFQFARPPHTDETYERTFQTSTSFQFKAEHHVSVDLARISAVDLEAIPMNVVIN